MNRCLPSFLGLALAALTCSAYAAPIVTSDVELTDGKVVFVVHNHLAVAATPKAVTLIGNGGCRVGVSVDRVVTIGVNAKVPVAAIELHELLQSCALTLSDGDRGIGQVRGVSGSPSRFLAKRELGSQSARGIPFKYMVEVGANDDKNRVETFTNGYVFVTP